MSQELAQKVKKYLDIYGLGLVITDLLSHHKIASILKRIGMDIPGVRLISIPKEELTGALVEVAWTEPEIMEELVEQPDVDQEKFINMLRHSGYTVKTRSLIRRADGSLKANWDVGIATDVINEVEKNNLDIVVLVTCDGDFVDLVRLLKPMGVRVEIAGFPYNTAMELKNIADEYYTIESDLMLTI